MINRLFIDGNDAYLQYGAYVVSGGWNELVAYPPLKSVESNDWQEEDGVEADLSEPVLNTREVSVKFAFGGLFSRFCLFIELLSDGAYHDFDCAYIGRKYRLRMTAAAEPRHRKGSRNGDNQVRRRFPDAGATSTEFRRAVCQSVTIT